MKNEYSTMKEEILAKIERGEVSMRPHWHFVLKGVLSVLGILMLALFTLYLTSFVLFVLRDTGVLFVPAFGFGGVRAFLLSSPWVLIALAIGFLVALELLVRHYSFSYRKPLLYTTIGIVLFAFLGTYVVAETGMHERLQGYAERDNLPVMGGMYRRYETLESENIHRGVIEELRDSGFLVQSRRETLEVELSGETRFPEGEEFSVGDRVVILGERKGDTIEARGVRKIPEGTPGFMRMGDGNGMHSRGQWEDF